MGSKGLIMLTVYDKKGREIKEGDVLRVFHYTSHRRKRMYMYKFVIIKDGELYALHLNMLYKTESSGYFVKAAAKNLKYTDAEIVNEDCSYVQSKDKRPSRYPWIEPERTNP
jgi:predicted RNA-binding protein (virulence factor B family)